MKRLRALLGRARGEKGFGLVEALIAVTILVIGLLAVAGLSMAAATQVRIAEWRTHQATAGQLSLEDMQQGGFAAAASKTDTVTIDGHDYVVAITVTSMGARVKEVRAQVAGVGPLGPREFRTRLYEVRPLPTP